MIAWLHANHCNLKKKYVYLIEMVVNVLSSKGQPSSCVEISWRVFEKLPGLTALDKMIKKKKTWEEVLYMLQENNISVNHAGANTFNCEFPGKYLVAWNQIQHW